MQISAPLSQRDEEDDHHADDVPSDVDDAPSVSTAVATVPPDKKLLGWKHFLAEKIK